MMEKYYDALGKRLDKEMQERKEQIKEQGADYAIECAYELTVKQEIIDCLKFDVPMTKDKIKALLSRKDILAETYQDWLSADGNLHESLEYTLEDSVNNMAEQYKKYSRNRHYKER